MFYSLLGPAVPVTVFVILAGCPAFAQSASSCPPNMVCGIPKFGPAPGMDDAIRKAQKSQAGEEEGQEYAVRSANSGSDDIMRERAHVDEVRKSETVYDEQAKKACRNLFASTYRPAQDSDKITWTTTTTNASNLGFTDGQAYLQVLSVGNTEPVSKSLDDAERASGIEYQGALSFRGTMYRYRLHKFAGSDEWSDWRELTEDKGRFAICEYEVRNGRVTVRAKDLLLGLLFDKLAAPTEAPPK
jgi:hypothetical protein